MEKRQRVDPVGCVVFGALGCFCVLFVALVAATLMLLGKRDPHSTSSPDPSASASTGTTEPLPTSAASGTTTTSTTTSGSAAPPIPSSAPAPPSELRRPIEGELRRADLQTLLPAAESLARELRPSAQLVGIIGWRSAAGAADLRPGNPMEGVSIQYEFETLPPKAEGGPGETGAEGTVLVTASRGEWLARWRPGPAWKLREDDFRAGPLDPPRCSSSDAWKATGLPTDRTFTVRYHNERAHHPRTPGVWKFDVGRSALAVDAGNCALLGAWE